MRRKWILRLLGLSLLSAIGACSGHPLPPKATILSYPGGDVGALQGPADETCAPYGQKAAVIGTESAADGGKVTSFKCQ